MSLHIKHQPASICRWYKQYKWWHQYRRNIFQDNPYRSYQRRHHRMDLDRFPRR